MISLYKASTQIRLLTSAVHYSWYVILFGTCHFTENINARRQYVSTYRYEDNTCRHTGTKCSGVCRSVGSRQGAGATRVWVCLNTRLGISSLTGLTTPATPRTNRRHLRHLTTYKFMRFSYSIPIPWNFCVKVTVRSPILRKDRLVLKPCPRVRVRVHVCPT
jgi:hypothetical protein